MVIGTDLTAGSCLQRRALSPVTNGHYLVQEEGPSVSVLQGRLLPGRTPGLTLTRKLLWSWTHGPAELGRKRS